MKTTNLALKRFISGLAVNSRLQVLNCWVNSVT